MNSGGIFNIESSQEDLKSFVMNLSFSTSDTMVKNFITVSMLHCLIMRIKVN